MDRAKQGRVEVLQNLRFAMVVSGGDPINLKRGDEIPPMTSGRGGMKKGGVLVPLNSVADFRSGLPENSVFADRGMKGADG